MCLFDTLAIWSSVRVQVVTTLGVATAGKHQVGSLVSLVGAVCGVPLGFVFPALIHMRLKKPMMWRHAVHCMIIMCGFAIQMFSLYYTICHWKSNPPEFYGSCAQQHSR